MIEYSIVPAQAAHAEAMIGKVRQCDVIELMKQSLTPRRALCNGLRFSLEKWTALASGQPIAMWGVLAPTMMSQSASPWVLCTAAMTKHKRFFVRMLRAETARLGARYVLHGKFNPENREDCVLLRRLGFKVDGNAYWLGGTDG